jgi:hypothetical protein
MNFDDFYMLKLSIKISDYENSLKYFKKVNKKKIDKEFSDILTNYCYDLRIFQIFSRENFFLNNSFKHFLNLLKTPVNNQEIIKYMMRDNTREFEKCLRKNISENKFYEGDEESIMLNLMRNSNTIKKLKIFDYFLNLEPTSMNEINLEVKSSKGQTNSQILISENPTNAEFILLEKIENFEKWKNEKNKFLFSKKNIFTNNPLQNAFDIENEIKNFISIPEESYKIGYADIEYNLIKLNLKLRKMYELNPFFLIKETSNEEKERLSKIHMKTLEDVIFNKLLLEKI